jgi:hypothetical protein
MGKLVDVICAKPTQRLIVAKKDNRIFFTVEKFLNRNIALK